MVAEFFKILNQNVSHIVARILTGKVDEVAKQGYQNKALYSFLLTKIHLERGVNIYRGRVSGGCLLDGKVIFALYG